MWKIFIQFFNHVAPRGECFRLIAESTPKLGRVNKTCVNASRFPSVWGLKDHLREVLGGKMRQIVACISFNLDNFTIIFAHMSSFIPHTLLYFLLIFSLSIGISQQYAHESGWVPPIYLLKVLTWHPVWIFRYMLLYFYCIYAPSVKSCTCSITTRVPNLIDDLLQWQY